MKLRSGYYRVSVKALILDETRTKFLLVQDINLEWDLPGGGLDWGELPAQGLAREISEEMGIEVTKIAENPTYFITMERHAGELWTANIIYETIVKSYDFVASDECIAVRFVSREDVLGMAISVPVIKFLQVFNSSNHS